MIKDDDDQRLMIKDDDDWRWWRLKMMTIKDDN